MKFVWSALLGFFRTAWFGTLKWFGNRGGAPAVTLHWPSAYLVENPRGYRIGGPETRAILADLQPGDILLRGVLAAMPLQPRPHALYPLAPAVTWLHVLERKTITPDDYYGLVHSGHLACLWEDTASQAIHDPEKATA